MMHGPMDLTHNYIAMINQHIFYQLALLDCATLNLLLSITRKADLL